VDHNAKIQLTKKSPEIKRSPPIFEETSDSESDSEYEVSRKKTTPPKKPPQVPSLFLPPADDDRPIDRRKALIKDEVSPRQRRSASFSVQHPLPEPPVVPQLKKRLSLSSLDSVRVTCDKGDKIVCRICEEEVYTSLLKEHTRFCVIANTWDMIALSNDDQLHKVACTLNDKISEVTKVPNELTSK
jgi:hypothetical protein